MTVTEDVEVLLLDDAAPTTRLVELLPELRGVQGFALL